MHLIGALVAGIRGCEDGYARIFRRGTSLAATLYPDFEASSSDSSGASVTLDAHGGAEVYVGELVDVFAYSSTGTLIRQFTAGASASNVEVISPSFLGVDYETGDTDGQKPVPLSTALERLVDSFGSVDFEVILRNDDRRMQDALAEIDVGYFNVKAPSYGAVGNGVADDSSAIQAALNAAAAAGGVVLLPPGTFRIGATLVIPQNVSLLGSGSAATTIMLDHASQDAIQFISALRRGCRIEGISFDVAQPAAGALINIDEQDTRLTVRDCRFAPTTASLSGICITSGLVTGLQVRIDDCYFAPNNVNANAITLQRGSPVIVGCQFVAPAGAANNQMIRADGEGCFVALCRFQFSAIIGGTCVGILATNNLSSGRPCIVIGNSFGATSGGTVSAWQLNCTSGNGVFETGNVVATGINNTILGLWDNTANEVSGSGSWDDRALNTTLGGGVTVVTLSDSHGQQEVISSAAGLLITLPTVRVGKTLRLIWHNNNAGAQNLSAPIGLSQTGPGVAFPFATNGNCFAIFNLLGIIVNGSPRWLWTLVGNNLAE